MTGPVESRTVATQRLLNVAGGLSEVVRQLTELCGVVGGDVSFALRVEQIHADETLAEGLHADDRCELVERLVVEITHAVTVRERAAS